MRMRCLLIILKQDTQMLRDNINSSLPNVGCLTIQENQEVLSILSFIDDNITGFKCYYIDQGRPVKENRISDLLIQYLQCCKLKYDDGFGVFDFRKNPTQLDSGKETDIGVYPLSLNVNPILPVFEFEAKRLSNSKDHRPNNKEYVTGNRGGMERFKRCEHSPHLTECGMLGYIQSDNADYWVSKINNWIQDIAQSASDLDWSSPNEALSVVDKSLQVTKLESNNSRVHSKDNIHLWHYMIELI